MIMIIIYVNASAIRIKKLRRSGDRLVTCWECPGYIPKAITMGLPMVMAFEEILNIPRLRLLLAHSLPCYLGL